MVTDDEYPHCLGADDPKENGIRKSVHQTTSDVTLDDGKLMWVLNDSIDSSISFGSEFIA